jgi:integrase
MSVRKRGRVWYYDFMIEGVRYCARVPGARDKNEAAIAEGQARHAVYTGTYGVPTGTEVFIDYAEGDYLTWARDAKRSWKSDEQHIGVFSRHFGRKRFKDISVLTVEEFKRKRRAAPTRDGGVRAPASINRELACLSMIFSRAIGEGKAASNPCEEVAKYPEDNMRYNYLRDEDEPQLLARCVGQREHLRNVIVFAINTGPRRGELLGLRKERVDFQQGVVWFANSRRTGSKTKSGKDRAVPLNEAARAVLLDQFQRYPRSRYCFPNPRTGNRMVDLKNGFTGACEAAGLIDFHFHDLRHTFGTRLAARGVHPVEIQKLMGHSTLKMTERYMHASDVGLRRAVDSLDRKAGTVLRIDERKERVG